MVDLTVIAPAYNEQGNLRTCVEETRRKLSATGVGCEIVVVDDGSTDDTWALCQQLAAEYPEVRPLRHERNRGMGAAVRTGMQAAKGDWVIVIPGDNQFDVDFARMIAAGAAADVVVGTRDGGYRSLRRKLPSWLYTTGMRALFGLRVRGEVNLYRRSILQGIEISSNGFFGNTELLLRVVQRGARVVGFPIRIRSRVHGQSTGRDPRRIAQVCWETAKLRARLFIE